MSTLSEMALAAAVKDEARRLGFDAVAIGPATPPSHGGAFERWLDEGSAGSMDYLERTRQERLDPARLLPGARAAIAVALSYHAPAPDDEAGSPRGMRVARYAGQADYHDVIRPRLEALARFIESAAGRGARSRAAVDTSALLERDLAARAGLGWFGKNTNLLTPALGSWFFIGIVLTTAEPAFDDPIADRCGTCTACLDACPTAAFTAPYTLDARRCIAYLTIEHRGDIDESLRPLIGEWGFGCDVCQEVCPWNRKAATTSEPAFVPMEALEPETLLALDDAAFRERFRHGLVARAPRGIAAQRGDRAGQPWRRRGGPGASRRPRRRRPGRPRGGRVGVVTSLRTIRVGPRKPRSLVRRLPYSCFSGSCDHAARRGVTVTMDQSKHDKQQSDQRRMDQGRNREAKPQSDNRNQEDTGKPVQLDREGKEHQGGQQQGGQQQGGQQRKPEPEHRPGQGEHTGQR
jgi:epoxyqueuosine reductase